MCMCRSEESSPYNSSTAVCVVSGRCVSSAGSAARSSIHIVPLSMQSVCVHPSALLCYCPQSVLLSFRVCLTPHMPAVLQHCRPQLNTYCTSQHAKCVCAPVCSAVLLPTVCSAVLQSVLDTTHARCASALALHRRCGSLLRARI